MKNVLQIDFPWLNLRSKFVKEDARGILYKSMLEEYASDNAKFQKVLEKKKELEISTTVLLF